MIFNFLHLHLVNFSVFFFAQVIIKSDNSKIRKNLIKQKIKKMPRRIVELHSLYQMMWKSLDYLA